MRLSIDVFKYIIFGLIVLFLGVVVAVDVAGGKMDEYTDIIEDKTTSVDIKRDSVELGIIDDTNRDYVLVANLGDIEIKDVEYLSLQIDPRLALSKADIISWSAYCHGKNVELFDAPVEIGEVTSSVEMESFSIGLLRSNGYDTEITCEHKIDVHISIGDRFFAGRGAAVKLFYEADR